MAQIPVGVTVECWRCHKIYHVPIPDAALEAWNWKKGEFIQVAWPEGSLDDRELLISKTCGKCFDEMWMDTE